MNEHKDTATPAAPQVWASFDCDGPEYLTRGKRYLVTSEAGDIFWIVDDEGDEIASHWVHSYHIDGHNWTRHTSPDAEQAGNVSVEGLPPHMKAAMDEAKEIQRRAACFDDMLEALRATLDELLCVRDYVDDASRGQLRYRGQSDLSEMAGSDLARIDQAIATARAAIAKATESKG
jgi:hypothetical protein